MIPGLLGAYTFRAMSDIDYNRMLVGFQEYFESIKRKKGTEFTFRTDLENLLKLLKPHDNILVIQEPEREEKFGAPDFRVERAGGIIGYLETKKIGENLDQVLRTGQLKRYMRLIHNLVLTNYHEFILIEDGVIVERATLFYLTDLDKGRFRLGRTNVEKTLNLLRRFFQVGPMQIGKPKDLAVHLAERAKILKEFIHEEITSKEETDFNRALRKLYDNFKDALVKDLDEKEFSDVYAQTVAYGLFLAFLNAGEPIKREHAQDHIPASFGVLREFFTFIGLYPFPQRIRWIFDEIIDLINNIDRQSLERLLSFRIGELGRKDPYINFYEDFLREFDPEKRKSMGVYYTPPAIVSFIVRSLNLVLKRKLGKNDGFRDTSVTVLDFATGTGTFLAQIFELMLEEENVGARESLIRNHILRNFFGFEYLIAPYAVAHLKLSQLLWDIAGYRMAENERLQVYLTNTLDDEELRGNALFPYMTREGENAHGVKTTDPILVIVGNPPYNVKSKNKTKWAKREMEAYRPKGERKINWDDYIKFIRYAHWKMERFDQGAIGIITNNSFLDGLTYRKMRYELLKTFDEIYILNLHGSTIRGETVRTEDESVFDIKIGTSISIFVKTGDKEPGQPGRVYYSEIYPYKREDKFKTLLEHDIYTIEWEELPVDEFDARFKATPWSQRSGRLDYFKMFVPIRNGNLVMRYGNFWGITEIFKEYNSGIQTKKNHLVVDIDKETLAKRIREVLGVTPENEIRFKYNLSDTSGWNLKRFKRAQFSDDKLIKFHYRPFDIRWVFYDRYALGRARYSIMRHLLNNQNLCLIFIRNNYGADYYSFALVTDRIADINLLGGQSYLAPLYLQAEPYLNNEHTFVNRPVPNFTDEFRRFISSKYTFEPKPEEILGYIYAILHSPTYRERYLEFLRIDFPRLPFVDNENLFKEIAGLGQKLIQHHLQKGQYSENIARFPVKGDDVVEKPRYHESKRRVYINDEQYFENVPPEIWHFQIGGYQVLDHWLKERKGRKLTYGEIQDFLRTVNILGFTIEQMERIDAVTKDWI